jgi:hypothetical protein
MEGFLVSIALRLSSLSGSGKIDAVVTRFRSNYGNARFSFWEPAPKGRFPWRTVYGSGSRFTVLGRLGGEKISVAARFSYEERKGGEGDLMLFFNN